jgi:hypothetical protein
LEQALDEETRRHKETVIALQKKDRKIKETKMQVDEERNAFLMVDDSVNRLNEKLNILKKQLADAVSIEFLHFLSAKMHCIFVHAFSSYACTFPVN